MANDLEKFLQQAAERLAQKASGRPANQSRPGGSSSLPSQAKPRPPVAEIISADIVEPSANRVGTLRSQGPDPLSTIDTRPELAQQISQADERMLEHVHQVFDHELTHLKAASSSLARQTQAPEPVPPTMPVISMLRNPNTLKAAFIASEIFKRK